ncbi:MAG: YhbY family RNA-binding protein [Anaeromyxobacter sp.]|nr:YhbY family RNA-binding protein [Anaeromyxobacter sp.]MBL0275339.1 YhbY family RNA-binding protein [Anaeromyxobacter sp.]
MPAPTNPKKQSLMAASPLRKTLRGAGHHLSPVVQVGKEGATPAVARALDEQLLAHELIKVKVGSESPEDRFEVAAWLAALPGVQVAQLIGRVVLLYRKHPERPRFEKGPPVARRAEPAPAPARPARPRKPRGAFGGGDRPARGERPPRGDRPFRGGRPEREERPARGGRPERGERPPRGDRPTRDERPARAGWQPRGERTARAGRPAREERSPRVGRPAREERPPRAGRPPRGERPTRDARPGRPARPAGGRPPKRTGRTPRR